MLVTNSGSYRLRKRIYAYSSPKYVEIVFHIVIFGSATKVRCLACNKDHHTMLHLKKALSANTAYQGDSRHNILTTSNPLVRAEGPTGRSFVLCTLVDLGFQSSLIVVDAANKQGVVARNVLASISGIAGVHAPTIPKPAKAKRRSNFDSKFELLVEAYVLRSLTTYLPNENLTETDSGWTRKLRLADPKYNVKGIDLVLGAVFEEIIEPWTKRRNSLMA